MDTQVLLWSVEVYSASEHESQRAFEIVKSACRESDRLEAIFADRAYRGDLEDELNAVLGLRLEITSSESEEPKRWIVECTFGWFGGWRRLIKEYKRLMKTSKAMVQLAFLQVVLNRLS